MWPTHVYNLGVGVAFFAGSLIGDWNAVQPINRQLLALEKILHLPDGSYFYVACLHCIESLYHIKNGITVLLKITVNAKC